MAKSLLTRGAIASNSLTAAQQRVTFRAFMNAEKTNRCARSCRSGGYRSGKAGRSSGKSSRFPQRQRDGGGWLRGPARALFLCSAMPPSVYSVLPLNSYDRTPSETPWRINSILCRPAKGSRQEMAGVGVLLTWVSTVVNGDRATSEHAQAAAHLHELTANLADRFAVLFAKISDCFEIGG